MARMPGTSRTWRWALCPCRHCRRERKGQQMFRAYKRAARTREERLWKRERA